MKKTDPKLLAYISREIREGRFIEVAAPKPRSSKEWVPIGTQHSEERLIERDVGMMVPISPFIVSVLRPASGVIAAVAIEPPQSTFLAEESAPVEQISSFEAARRISKSVKERERLDARVLSVLNASTAPRYSELVNAAGDAESLQDSLKRMQKFKDHTRDIQTLEGVVTFEPKEILAKAAISDESWTVQLSYLGFVPARSAHEGELSVSIGRVLEGCAIPELHPVLRVKLDTLHNQRALKILQGAQMMDLTATAIIGRSFNLSTRKWSFSLREIADESMLLNSMGAVGAYISDCF